MRLLSGEIRSDNFLADPTWETQRVLVSIQRTTSARQNLEVVTAPPTT